MAFRDCILSARAQGALTAEEADDLLRRYQAHRDERAAAGHADPEAAAKAALAASLDEDAARAKWHADLTEAKRGEILENAQDFRGRNGAAHVYEAMMRHLEHFGNAGFDSVAGMGKAIVGLMHGELETMLRGFERNYITGFRHDRPAVPNLVRDMLGEPTGSSTSQAFAKSMGEVFEKLRVMYNELGGNIGKLDRGYIPQYNDPTKLRAATFEKWREDILPRLDPARMRDPITGEPIRPDRLEESLRPVYDQIVSEGWATRVPSSAPAGRGSLANQRQDHRFLAFKSADDWMWYDKAYGHGDPLAAMFMHINGMARDIAAMKVLGPNPGSMIEWMKQVVQSEHGKARVGKESLWQTPAGFVGDDLKAGEWAANRIDDLWYHVRGRSTINQTVADFFGDVRNILTGTMLGSASITAATTDPVIERMARRQIGMADTALFGSNAKVFLDSVAQYFEQLPLLKVISHGLDYFTGAPRQEAARAGMIVDSYLHILGDEARFAGTLGGHFWSRWVAERTVNLSGLTALTNARKSVYQLDVMAHVADHSAMAFDKLPDRLRNTLDGYGIDAAAWDKLRAVSHYTPDRGTSGFIRPKDVAAIDFDLAARYADMLLGETERAVPTGTLRSKAYVMGQRPRGSGIGEIVEGGLQFKSFGMSMVTNQVEAGLMETARYGRPSGASYAAQLLIATGVMGGLSIQLKALKDGKDLQDMRSLKFIIASMATGGGLGIYGDFLFKDFTQLRGSFAEQMAGPTVSTTFDFAKFLIGNMEKIPEGKSEFLHEGVRNLLGRYTPGLSSLWQLKLLYQREVIDKLDEMVDPKAHRRWKQEEGRMMKEKGQGYWWPHGAAGPERPPNLGSAVGQ